MIMSAFINSFMLTAESIEIILHQLKQAHPNATYELDWDNPFQLLVATILAAQCTDERVNRVTKTLFPKYPTPRSYVDADILELAADLKPTGFYRKKAQVVRGVCQALIDRFDGEVPQTMAEMVTLPGIARKTANVILNCGFNLASGIIVDTHVIRVSQRLGLSQHQNPDKIERDLMKLLPETEWIFFGAALILHGRYTCTASNPQCTGCGLAAVCDRQI